MSQINVNTIRNRTGGPPNLDKGAVVTGILTCTGNVSVGGTLTYEDVTNIDSTGIVTAKSGIFVGNPVSPGIGATINPNGNAVFAGIVTASSFSGIQADKIFEGNTEVETIDTGSDGHVKMTTEGSERVRVGPAGQIGLGGANYGTSGQLLTSGGSGSAPAWTTVSSAPTAQLVTSENLVAGDTISIKSNGQVEKVASNVTQITPVNGTKAEVNGSPDGDEVSCALDPLNPTKAYAIYKHQNGNVYSKIGNINGIGSLDDISWSHVGTFSINIASSGNDAVSLCNIGSGKYLAAVQSNSRLYVRVVNVNYSAGSISVETNAAINGTTECTSWDIESYGTDRAVLTYRSITSSGLTYAVGLSVSGNTVTVGTPVLFDNFTNNGNVNIRRAGNTSKFLLTWYKDTSDGLLCRMGDFNTSTNAVSIVGNELTLDSSFGSIVGQKNALTYTKDNKWVCAYKAISGYHKGIVISYDGSSTITKGAILQISGNLTDYMCLAYDSDGDRIIDMFQDNDTGSGSLWASALSVSGTTLTASALDEVSSDNSCHIRRRAAFYAPYWGATLAISEMASSNRMYKILIKSSTVTTNSANFIGFVGSSFSASSTATIQVVGNINANQSGLTPGLKYYVSKDGTLSQNEANPSVYAGRALSATSLLIKG